MGGWMGRQRKGERWVGGLTYRFLRRLLAFRVVGGDRGNERIEVESGKIRIFRL